MSQRQARWCWGVLAAGVVVLVALSGQAQQEKPADVAKLLPADSIVYFGWDGNAAHREAYEQTAAYQALYESGLMPGLAKMFRGAGGNQPEQMQALQQAYEFISERGMSLSIAVPSDETKGELPFGVVVLHEAAPLEPKFSEFVRGATQGRMQFRTEEISDRTVTHALIPNTPGIQVGWWVEGAHLMLAVGLDAVNSAIEVAGGDAPNVTTSELWKKYHEAPAEFEATSTCWFDFGRLRTLYGKTKLPNSPNPDEPLTVNRILEALGLDTVGALACRSGYKGRATVSRTVLEAPGPRKGIMALFDQKPITLKDLPPLPWETEGFYACSVDWVKFYDEVTELARRGSALGPPEARDHVEQTIDQVPAIVGFEPKAELFEPLGDVVCVYGDPRQGAFGMGFGVAAKVDDAETLKTTLNKVVDMVVQNAEPGQIEVQRTNKHGREIVTLSLGGGMANPSFAVDENWLCVALIPQSVEAFLLRLDERLAHWEPSPSYVEALNAVPGEFASISSTDPRKTIRFLVGLGPVLLPAIQQGIRQAGVRGPDGEPLKLSAADLPPAELVARPLFPNVSVCTVTDETITWQSRSSLPAIPILGSGGGGNAAIAAVGVALILPAIQQARYAARRAQSQNHLKMMGLALHNYHDANSHFPQGTQPNEDLKPEKRLSWMAAILPYLDQAALHREIDFGAAWDAEPNQEVSQTAIAVFQNPGRIGDEKAGPAAAHYVGIAGLGKDGPTLPVDDKKAGVFAYNRTTRLRDITDGTSNTMMVAEASKDFGSWAAGGKPTMRPFTTKPYLNGPDGIGGPWGGQGTHVLFCDGAVRFLSDTIDPTVIEQLTTICGGEIVGDF